MMSAAVDDPLFNQIRRCLDKLAYRARGPGRKIDVVYTWVDGNDPAFCSSLTFYRARDSNSEDPLVAGNRRFQNNDELRYSLRSLEAHVPWINNVFLVTNGQTPAWLRPDHPRLRMVAHKTIFTNKTDLPTFNSAAIEIHLHRIPGLSRQFLYLNDDSFFGRPGGREDFFSSSGKPRILIEPWRLTDSTDEHGDIVHRFLAYNHGLLKTAFGERDYASLPHAPVFYDQKEMRKVQKLWRKEFKRTSSQRFRQEETVMPHILYSHHQNSVNRCEPAIVGPGEYIFVMFRPPLAKTLAELEEVKRIKPKFFTINDDWDDRSDTENTVLRNFLEDYFPNKSSFEK